MRSYLGMHRLSFFLIALAIFGLAGFAYSNSPDSSKQATSTELKTVNQGIDKLKNQLKTLNKKRTSNEKLLLETEQDINALKNDMTAIEQETHAGLKTINELQDQKKILLTKKEKENQRISSSLRSLYLTSNNDRLKLILNQENPEDISRHLMYLEYLQAAQLKAIKAFEVTIKQLEQNKHEQESVNQTLISQRERLTQKNKILVTENSQRQKLIAQLLSQYQKDDKKLNNLEIQRKELEAILSQLDSQNFRSNKPFNKMKGKLPWPVKGKLLSNYNQLRSDTQMRWDGVLISALIDQKTTAVHDGQVIFADWLRGYGQLIIIDHGDDYLTLYAHNQSLLKQEGSFVVAGEQLALIGQTGGQSTPALYFEVRFKGRPQDPLIWLGKQLP